MKVIPSLSMTENCHPAVVSAKFHCTFFSLTFIRTQEAMLFIGVRAVKHVYPLCPGQSPSLNLYIYRDYPSRVLLLSCASSCLSAGEVNFNRLLF